MAAEENKEQAFCILATFKLQHLCLCLYLYIVYYYIYFSHRLLLLRRVLQEEEGQVAEQLLSTPFYSVQALICQDSAARVVIYKAV